MRLKTPKFWYEPASAKAHVLTPFSFLYGAGHKIHQSAIRPYKSQIPVLCIGNLVTGGSGKTPTAMAILQLIRDHKLANRPCFLTRGYGGKTKGHILVNMDSHTATDVGDEPLLLAKKAPTIIAADRKDGARYAEGNGYDLIIMDDGLQNPGLQKDLCFVVIDGITGFGNNKMIPAGPLREPLTKGLQKADAFIIIGDDNTETQKLLPKETPVFKARMAVPESWISNEKTEYIAFCGIANPEKFKKTLEETRLNILSWHTYADHYNFTTNELHNLSEEAKAKNARLITTAKDAVRIPSAFARELPLDILPIEIKWEDEEAVASFLEQKIKTT